MKGNKKKKEKLPFFCSEKVKVFGKYFARRRNDRESRYLQGHSAREHLALVAEKRGNRAGASNKGVL
jgi:hypothetical protein